MSKSHYLILDLEWTTVISGITNSLEKWEILKKFMPEHIIQSKNYGYKQKRI